VGEETPPYKYLKERTVMSATDVEVKIDEKVKQVIAEPKRYKVIFLNDDKTPIEFVVELLMTTFRHSELTAKDITLAVHNEGSAVVGVYTYEIAEQKTIESTQLCRQHGFPLQIRVEQE
jgi:ATP-dependent Clp protease adaptor protein ClpS